MELLCIREDNGHLTTYKQAFLNTTPASTWTNCRDGLQPTRGHRLLCYRVWRCGWLRNSLVQLCILSNFPKDNSDKGVKMTLRQGRCVLQKRCLPEAVFYFVLAVCMFVYMYICMHACTPLACLVPSEGVRSSGTSVTDGCEPLGVEPGPLE